MQTNQPIVTVEVPCKNMSHTVDIQIMPGYETWEECLSVPEHPCKRGGKYDKRPFLAPCIQYILAQLYDTKREESELLNLILSKMLERRLDFKDQLMDCLVYNYQRELPNDWVKKIFETISDEFMNHMLSRPRIYLYCRNELLTSLVDEKLKTMHPNWVIKFLEVLLNRLSKLFIERYGKYVISGSRAPDIVYDMIAEGKLRYPQSVLYVHEVDKENPRHPRQAFNRECKVFRRVLLSCEHPESIGFVLSCIGDSTIHPFLKSRLGEILLGVAQDLPELRGCQIADYVYAADSIRSIFSQRRDRTMKLKRLEQYKQLSAQSSQNPDWLVSFIQGLYDEQDIAKYVYSYLRRNKISVKSLVPSHPSVKTNCLVLLIEIACGNPVSVKEIIDSLKDTRANPWIVDEACELLASPIYYSDVVKCLEEFSDSIGNPEISESSHEIEICLRILDRMCKSIASLQTRELVETLEYIQKESVSLYASDLAKKILDAIGGNQDAR